MWAKLTKDGIASWFGPEPVAGAEDIGDVDWETLVTCRLVDGKWVTRDRVKPPEPAPALARDPVPEPEPEPEPLDIKAELAALAEKVAELQAAIEDAPAKA